MWGTYSSQEERKYKQEKDIICSILEENIMKKKKSKNTLKLVIPIFNILVFIVRHITVKAIFSFK